MNTGLKEKLDLRVLGQAHGSFWKFSIDDISFEPSEIAMVHMRARYEKLFGRKFDESQEKFNLYQAQAKGEFYVLDRGFRKEGLLYLRELKGLMGRPTPGMSVDVRPWYNDPSFISPTVLAPSELSIEKIEVDRSPFVWGAPSPEEVEIDFYATDSTRSKISIHARTPAGRIFG